MAAPTNPFGNVIPGLGKRRKATSDQQCKDEFAQRMLLDFQRIVLFWFEAHDEGLRCFVDYFLTVASIACQENSLRIFDFLYGASCTKKSVGRVHEVNLLRGPYGFSLHRILEHFWNRCF
jgi:hypothetical protein